MKSKPTMIDIIKGEARLKRYVKKDYQRQWLYDAGTLVYVDKSLGSKAYAAVKVDDYYNGQHLGKLTPKSVDFVVAVDCQSNHYALYLLEFKNVEDVDGLKPYKDIREKFQNTLARFMSQDFQRIFCQFDRFMYKKKDSKTGQTKSLIRLYLISDPYHFRDKYPNIRTYAEYKDMMSYKRTMPKDTTELDFISSLNSKLFSFGEKRNKHILKIEFELPENVLIRRIT